MTIFKVGDEVEVVRGSAKGYVGTITDHRGSKAIWPWYVKYPKGAYDGSSFGIFNDSELKLVQPKRKFKVGDTVTFCMPDYQVWQGGEGIVRSVPTETRSYYKVEIVTPPPTNNAQRPGNKVDLLEEWLEAAAPKPKTKFQVGDIVKSVGFQYEAFEGNKTLIVDHLTGERTFPYAVRALGEDYEKGHNFREDELEAGEPLDDWEIELLDSGRPSLKAKALANYAVADVKATQVFFEAVKHPAHYGGGDNPYEAIKVIEAWGLGFNLGNALKYLARAGKKGNKVEDLNKLIQYVQFEIAKEEAK